jgi:hypothetical protein
MASIMSSSDGMINSGAVVVFDGGSDERFSQHLLTSSALLESI